MVLCLLSLVTSNSFYDNKSNYFFDQEVLKSICTILFVEVDFDFIAVQEGDFEMKHIDKVGSQTFNVAIAPFSLSTLGDESDTFEM